MTSRRKEIFFVALCVVFSALFTIGCSDSLLHPAQDGARILVQLENSSLRSGDTPSPAEKWQGNAWIENRDGSESHHQKISSAADEFSITFENVVIGSEIKICLDMTSTGDTPKRYTGSSNWREITSGINVIVIVLKEVGEQGGDEPGQENPPSQEPGTTTPDAGVVSGELGSQTNPVTTWAKLAEAVKDSATSTIYVDVHTMTATERSITFNGNKQIIPLQNLTIERGADFRGSFFEIAANGTLTLTSATYKTVLDGKNIAADNAMIYSSGTLELSNVELKNGNYSNSSQISSSSGGLFIYSGNTTLENVIFSGNTSSLYGAKDIFLHQNTQNIPTTLAIGTSISVEEMYFSAAMPTGYPVIQVNQNSSLKDTNKIKITVGNGNPENIQIVTKDRYTGDLNTLFTVVGTNGTSYALDEEGKVVQYSLGSQTNPVTTWADLVEAITGDTPLQSPIYISSDTMVATETIMVNAEVELISVGRTTITRSSGFSDAFFENKAGLTFTGTKDAPIIFEGDNIGATSPIISANADLTMTYCTLQNNVNTSTSGGAIHITEGVLKLNDCVFESNKTMSSTGQGGALCVEGQTTKSQITSSSFTNNTATFGGGAIIYNGDVAVGTDYTHTLRSCIFTGNSTSGGNGGGIYMHKGYVTIDGIEMSDNTQGASNDSQDIYFLKTNDLILTGNDVSIQSLYYNFSNSQFPQLKVVAPFNSPSPVSIILSPDSTNADYPEGHQLFTLPDGVSVFNWVSNFTITGADGSSYSLNDYGVISKL